SGGVRASRRGRGEFAGDDVRIDRHILSLVTAALIGLDLLAGGCDRRPDAAAIPTPPGGMVYEPGGRVHMGSEDGPPHERPRFWAEVEPFFMDIHPVTVAQFREFVDATGYVT